MNTILAKHFLSTEVGIKWKEKCDYSELYGALGTFCALHTTSYEVPDPDPIADAVIKLIEQSKEGE
jgi:hypothetical protein